VDPLASLAVDPSSPVPPFEQLRTSIAAQVTDGDLPPGTRLPPVRQLAADLGLAANTVARAYRELEADGVVATHGRRGTFVTSHVQVRDTDATGRLAREYVAAARRQGLSRAEATRLVDDLWAG
jgi:DNA-binding transcriptional regulator YhcF (GntR family)